MKKFASIATALLFIATAKPTLAYDTGKMTCTQIGDMASAIVLGKEKGNSLQNALAAINHRMITQGYMIEAKIIEDIATQIYTADFAKGLSQEGAQVAYYADCVAQK